MSIRVISTTFNEIFFHVNAVPRKAFTQKYFHEMQEKQNEKKAKKPWLLIPSVGRIARQHIIAISAYYPTNNTGI